MTTSSRPPDAGVANRVAIPPELGELAEKIRGMAPDELEDLVDSLPPAVMESLVRDLGSAEDTVNPPIDLVDLGDRLYSPFSSRPHLTYLSDKIVAAVRDVEQGHNRQIIVEMPPRSGKTTMTTLLAPAWIRYLHPEWPIALTSHDSMLAKGWGRQLRRWSSDGHLGPSVRVAYDAGAVGEWETTAGGKTLSLSIRESITGRGVKVLVIDDPHKDFIDAHSETMRNAVWNWWLSTAQTRLEPPYLVLVVQTRWHTDDLTGRLTSPEHEGDPHSWEVIRLPALAEDEDALGRAPGEPLFTPLLEETSAEAVERWESVRHQVGTYTFAAMYQQRPAPAKGATFSSDWWRYWTRDPSKVSDDGRVVLLPAEEDLSHGVWCDSWDASFGVSKERGSYVVGQRWTRLGADRYLIAQQRERMTFTETLEAIKRWAGHYDTPDNPHGNKVHTRLVEAKANGPAIIEVISNTVSGVKPIMPKESKESRAQAVTPEIESGNVYLPLPSDEGNDWVQQLTSELRDFPYAANDDQVDTLSQALSYLREPRGGRVYVPGEKLGANGRRRSHGNRTISTSRAAAAKTQVTRAGGR